MENLVKVYDSAGGYWAEDATHILAYCDSWGGWYQGRYYATNVELAMAMRPHARIIQIAVRPPVKGVVVDGYDVEPGALTVAEACGIANHDVVVGRRPFLYANSAENGWDIATIRLYIKEHYTQIADKVDYWVAEPDGDPTVPEGCIAKQYSWPNLHPVVAQQKFDVSVLLSTAACLQRGDPQPRG